jgi:hypothetical protein
MAVRLSALRTHRALYSRNINFFLLLVLISARGLSEPQGLVRLEGLGKFKMEFVVQLQTLDKIVPVPVN